MGCGCSCLDQDQYVILDYPAGKGIKYGPGCYPFCCARSSRRSKLRLDNTEYVLIKKLRPDGPVDGEVPDGIQMVDQNNDIMQIIAGPCLFQPNDPYDEIIGEVRKKVVLKKNNYLIITDKDGNKRVEVGPQLYTPQIYEKFENVINMVNLTETEYVVVENRETGERRVEVGQQLFCPGPYDKMSEKKKMAVLNDNQYIYVTHTDTGSFDIVQGPTKFTPGPYDSISNVQKKIALQLDEYMKVVDNNSGIIRVIKGPATVVLKQYENTMGDVTKAIEINEHNAAYILDTQTGDYSLIEMEDEPFMFFPSEVQQVVEKREKLRLEKHEVVVIVDKTGKYIFKYGREEDSAFFVPPYCHLLTQEWSTDLEKDHQNVAHMSRFDLRPQYMNFKFMIRTSDNVEIFIILNFYWQILDVEKMVSTTEDAPEDICKHAMSQILSDASRKTMQEFMESFNEVVQGAISKDDGFYDERGVRIIRVEITGRRCKEDAVEQNFQAIIKEKTERIRKLEEKTGENEVVVRDLEGKLKAEDLKGMLIAKQRDYMRAEAKADGESDADKIKNFFDNLPEGLDEAQKMTIFMDKQNTERVQIVSEKINQLTVLPTDLDIKLVNMTFSGQNDNQKIIPLPIEDGDL